MSSKPILRGTGRTGSERYLSSLAARAFLRLWSYPNTYIDKKRNGKGDGKEFADLTVVFGNDIILFSDKDIAWPEGDKTLAWSRWYRRAIRDSVKQLEGAARWLTSFEDRIFIDAACDNPFPIAFPPPATRRVHGVAIAVGGTEACRKHFEDPSGTFAVIPSILGADHSNTEGPDFQPFAIGDVNPNGLFIHVFDPAALDIILRELDTVSDFVDYLNQRASFIRSGNLSIAAGEEDLLAYFLQSSSSGGDRSFLPPELRHAAQGRLIAISAGEYEGLRNRPEYERKRKANKVSYLWDRLIENFIGHVLAGTSVTILDAVPDVHLAERALRIMAAENRTYRRVLGRAVEGAMLAAEQEHAPRFVRNILPLDGATDRAVGYVFLILAYPGDEVVPDGYAGYRRTRASMLETYCFNLFEMRPDLETVVGIAIDASPKVTGREGGSEDLLAMQRPEWDDDLRKRLSEARELFGLLPQNQLRRSQTSELEYPLEGSPFVSRQQRRAAERQAAKQRRSYSQQP